ncbi:hypothetical protein [Granulicella arctica]|uniref:Bacterial HORMA domain-containing protein n=1 Tax=Granulicella arctica TaxID=940613 RepID=A0A7Y9PE30_9BACT|nr:hypothetical protein [Granulicella arctica]NYF77984.1 hypothetical protein [Granulicella arctica]
MSTSYSISGTESFTITHARKIACKVATDLKRFQRLYARTWDPTDQEIDNYEAELVHLLKHDVVGTVIYGYMRAGKWTQACVRYHSTSGGELIADDDPGKIKPGYDIAGASFTSFLTYNSNWDSLSPNAREAIKSSTPLQRGTGSTPVLETGYWSQDLTYSAGGRGIVRSIVKG